MPAISLDDVRRAAARIAPVAGRTPVFTSRTFDSLTGATCFFKCENFQRGGAFKLRGAANAVLSLPQEQLQHGVVTYSSGNHAQAVAIACSHAGVPACIVMPQDAPRAKLEATRGYGAEVILYDRHREDRVAIGESLARERNATIIPPFDHPDVIAGQGTCALELLQEQPELDALAVCIGGGGLISGCSIAAHSLHPGIRIFGVEPELANDTYLSLRAGRRIEISPPATIADGLRSQSPGRLTFPLIQQFVEHIALVTEDEIRATMRFLLLRMKIVAEPSGAVAAAAVLHRKLPDELKRIGIIVSGGNVDYEMLAAL